jgi:hypothetical protein
MRELRELGLKPIGITIELCNSQNWPERECFWIDHFKKAGYNLLNTAPGGYGPTDGGAIAAALKGIKPSAATMAGFKRFLADPIREAERRKKLAEKTKAHWNRMLPEQRAAFIARRDETRIERLRSPESRAKMSAARKENLARLFSDPDVFAAFVKERSETAKRQWAEQTQAQRAASVARLTRLRRERSPEACKKQGEKIRQLFHENVEFRKLHSRATREGMASMSEEKRAAMLAPLALGKTPESNVKRSATLKATSSTDEARKRLASTSKNYWNSLTAEQRQARLDKLRAARLAKGNSEETREKVSAGLKAYFARKKQEQALNTG